MALEHSIHVMAGLPKVFQKRAFWDCWWAIFFSRSPAKDVI